METFGWRHATWNSTRRPFLTGTAGAGFALILLFLANYSYLYGSVFESGRRIHKLNILAVDYDGSSIGESLSVAYQRLQSDEFPSLQFRSAAEYPSPSSIRDAVCRGHYWAAVYTQAGASSRLSDALGGVIAAGNFTASSALGMVINSARYPSVQLGNINGNLQALSGATRSVYLSVNGKQALATVNSSDANAISALMNPIQTTTLDIQPTNQGNRVLYNTVGMVFPLLQQFFFHMAMNNFHIQFQIHGRLHVSRIILMRLIIGLVYTFISSLVVTGVVWAFNEGWGLSGSRFALSWMAYWLFMHVGFLVMDTAVAFIPLSFMSFFVLTWIIVNVSSTIFPLELYAGFFKVGHMMPAHETYQILVQIWSGGCNNQLYHALPVLFAWEVVGTCTTILGMIYQSRIARRELIDSENTNNVMLEEIATQNQNQGSLKDMDGNTSAERLQNNDRNESVKESEFSGNLQHKRGAESQGSSTI